MTSCPWRNATDSGHATSHVRLMSRQWRILPNRWPDVSDGPFQHQPFWDAHCSHAYQVISESSAISLSAKPPLFQHCRFSWRKPTAQPWLWNQSMYWFLRKSTPTLLTSVFHHIWQSFNYRICIWHRVWKSRLTEMSFQKLWEIS